jgi:hypothetical protein
MLNKANIYINQDIRFLIAIQSDSSSLQFWRKTHIVSDSLIQLFLEFEKKIVISVAASQLSKG